MADEFQRNKLYEYRANSNLVLEADKESRRRDEAGLGEVETLHGKLDTIRMGDRLKRGGGDELSTRIEKMKSKRDRAENEPDVVRKKKESRVFVSGKGSTVMTVTEDLDSINYRPKTRESRLAYEEILSIIQSSLGDQPQDILRGAADEVLALLKDEYIRDPDRLKEISKIMPRLTTDKFSKLVSLGKKITDFFAEKEGEDDDGARMDEEMGVAVVFDDEEDEDEDNQEVDEINNSDDEEDEEEEGGVEATGSGTLRGGDDGDDGVEEDKGLVSVHEIDAHWLQRQLSKFYSDANVSSRLAEESLQTLQLSDERAVENRLVVLLDYDKFDFIKVLLKNRAKIYYCTRLKQAQSEAESKAVEAEMLSDPSGAGAAILQQLTQRASAESWSRDRLGEMTTKAKREARALNRAGGGTADAFDVVDEAFAANITTGAKVSGFEKIVDLDGLQFAQGSHFMANTRCELPEKSWRAQKKGYEEVHVPAIRPIIPSSERLVNIDDLPDWAQPAFDGMRSLNRIQSKMVQAALFSSDNLLLCAPTGAGKTNVALMCMLNQLGQHRREDGSFDLDSFKIVYIAPMKALVQECVQSFGKRLKPFGVTVRELSGDQNLSRQQIQETQIIITTPEKWDIITRKAGDRTYTQLVRLMIIDEIHLLHDDRGPVLESLVARVIRQIESTREMVRLVGLSATLPNYEDVGTFLRVVPEKGLFYFDSSFRPVPLQQQYIGVTEKKALKRFQLMNEICYEKVLQQAGRNQVLIFTHSRAETAKTAKALRDMAMENDALGQFVAEDSASREILREEAEKSAKSADLKDLLPHGFAIHHAGMVRTDRSLVEDLFADKHVQVLVSTATLAWGVNLPCHTVIIKGTQMYSPEQSRWVELSPLDIMQMMGRAGRYGMDSEGEGIIMTAHSELQYYLSLMNQQLPIESQFVKKLPDNLNAEIVLGNVLSVKEAADWLSYTYLHVRMQKRPALYGVPADRADEEGLAQRRLDLAHTAASILDKNNLIKYDRKSGNFQPTTLGRIASYFYVSHDSIKVFNEFLKPSMSEIEIFRLFSLSGEFKHIHVRDEEKIELQKLIGRVPIPVKEGVEEPSAKVNILLQSYISRLKLEGFALAADMTFIQQSAARLMRALFEIALKRNWSALAQKTLMICKMVEKRTWGCQSPLRQFSAIPEVIIRKLEKNSDLVWDRYYDLKPQDLGEMVKIPKMGKTLYKYVHMFPKLLLSAAVQPVTRSLLRIDLTITADFEFDASAHDAGMLFWIIVEDVDGEIIKHCEPFMLKARMANVEHNVNLSVTLMDPLPPQYFIKVISDRWMHSEAVLPISFRHLLLPQKYPPPTELLDLQPLPVSALSNRRFERLYPSFKRFNPIQTQTFAVLFESDDNVLVCAPTGSGKTVCAEFAILRLFKSNPAARCVYLAPKEEIANIMFKHWENRFEGILDITVVQLTGDTTADLLLLERGNLIIATAVHWDSLSRRWKQRKNVQDVSLVIVDELHLIGGVDGPTLEVVVSRARYVASQIERKVRIVALSSSLANAKDVGDWIGATSHNTFNFAPDVRSVPVDIHIHGFETSHFGSRLLAMARPTFNSLAAQPPHKPSIVFVPSRKQSQLTAIDIVTSAATSGNPDRFLFTETARIAFGRFSELLSEIKDPVLSQTLAHGVAFLHPGLPRTDKLAVEELYKTGLLGVLVTPHNQCWSVPGPAHLVVIMDTVYYEGRDHKYVDCSISDILQMVGLASRPLLDDSGLAIVLCQSPKKEYLKKLLHDPLPVESHLDQFLHDHICAEVVTKTIENKQDAVDYLTWTFLYRRLTQNPNYYNMQGITNRHLSDHMSELVENVIQELESSKCLTVEDDFELTPLNLGMISSYYYIQYTTIELFASSLTAKTKVKGLLEILSASTEYAAMPIRQHEERLLEGMAKHLPLPLPATAKYDDPATKVLILLQSHLSRIPLSTELKSDLHVILNDIVKLIQSVVDVISSNGWLKPALSAMVLSQMVIQGLWERDSVLLQVPHFTSEIVDRCSSHEPPVESVLDVLELDDEVRDQLLQLPADKMSDVAVFCNAYPSIDLSYSASATEATVGDSVILNVSLKREGADDVDMEVADQDGVRPTYERVISQRFSKDKAESWWLVVGDVNTNTVLTIKRMALTRSADLKLEFSAPDEPGDYNLVLYLMSDSYLGCDQEYEFNLTVVADDEEE